MTRRGHIVTVGTSLLTNSGSRGTAVGRPSQATVQSINKMCTNLQSRMDHQNCNDTITKLVEKIEKLDPAQEFGHRPTEQNGPVDRLPQELSYLYKFAVDHPLNGEERHIVRLLCSDTPQSKICGMVLENVLNGQSNNFDWSKYYDVRFDVDQDYAVGVKAADGNAFGKVGVLNWMQKIKGMVEELTKQGCNKIYLNVTGGYKGTVPYSTLMGMLNREVVEIAYIFEESEEIIYIPSYPMGLDFEAWHRNALRLRMFEKSISGFMPAESIQALFYEDGHMSALGTILHKKYDEQLKTNPLVVYSRDIVSRLLTGFPCGVERYQNEAENLKSILDELLEKYGDIIWLGDKIPELVEHAHRHHHDLLEFTELFLTPILTVNPCFLNIRERFVLLAGVMLHDCGHVLDQITRKAVEDLEDLLGKIPVGHFMPKEFSLFSPDVREYHQYLAAVRLNDSDLAQDLGWPGCAGFEAKGLPGNLHTAVLMTALYHRRCMDFSGENNEKGWLHPAGLKPKPLMQHVLTDSIKKDDIDILKTTALLRIIDGCDSQTHRAGPKAQVDLTLTLLKRALETSSTKVQLAMDAFKSFCKETPNALCEKLKKTIIKKVGGLEVEDGDRSLRLECLKMVEDTSCDPTDKQASRLWLMMAEAAGQASFGSTHWQHYLKHRLVKEIHVQPGEDFNKNNYTFEVILYPDDSGHEYVALDVIDDAKRDAGYWLAQRFDNNQSDTYRQVILDEVSSEFLSVKEFAQKTMGLTVGYRWSDE